MVGLTSLQSDKQRDEFDLRSLSVLWYKQKADFKRNRC